MTANFVSKTLKNLRQCNGGNATLLVALGMPVLIGGAGLGVDVTQWYMWKRELQFAVDQAAVAGAWARAEADTESTYVERAEQEFAANLSVTDDFNADPDVQLANFAGGTLNSVAVSATATKPLPFTSFLTGKSATIFAFAQASFEEGEDFTSCLIATDPDDEGAVTIGGNAVLTASCGMQALSTDDLSIRVNGNPDVDAGWILSAGGIDEWLKNNTDDVILEYQDGLFDPFADLDPPNPAESQVARTYSCSAQGDTTFADVDTRTVTDYSYWSGPNKNNVEPWEFEEARASSDVSTSEDRVLVQNGTVAGTDIVEEPVWRDLGGTGQNKKWERRDYRRSTTYSNIEVMEGGQAGNVRPGTYANIHIGCDTAFAPGVYNIVGGSLTINGQHEVSGAGVMFVLYEGASIHINGGADINLTAMTASDLMAVGVSPTDANDLAEMLVFEDRDGPGAGNNGHSFNGNAETVLNGKMYFPVSEVFFAGTASVTSMCLMIAANNITITGTTDMQTFCPPDTSEETITASTAATVRLVA
ncbi:TadE/TadG family type IV pilus assembly protein [Aurantiacibacter poecillastricola]|uniref:TadE/TadG family type IV pilus assembly protein n=1 Tax=Aurantiacibacter poecillastricola TaxID=3064385 RepID=UPI00273F1F07|nr:pilus assembly protein TadG-related protein [Aurantiacibacter sp. 219JJ12-13]MDP5262073.1 pilus assembly protein TadG-related protein [Aurantiacibacter sp. 219JJ12-13]